MLIYNKSKNCRHKVFWHVRICFIIVRDPIEGFLPLSVYIKLFIKIYKLPGVIRSRIYVKYCTLIKNLTLLNISGLYIFNRAQWRSYGGISTTVLLIGIYLRSIHKLYQTASKYFIKKRIEMKTKYFLP